MASSNVASSSIPYAPGNVVVVTHVFPAAPNGEQQPLLDRRQKFRKGHPKALGTVQIMTGAVTLLFGIAAAVYQPSLGVYSGIFVWGALIYITSGSVTVAAEKSLSRCLLYTSLVFNIIAAVVAVTGVVLYALDPVVWYYPYGRYSSRNYGGYSAVVAVFQLLELIISITVAVFASQATCCCCCTEPRVFVQTVDGSVIPQAPPHFQAASVAPAQPHPQVAPDFINPGNLGSTEPPAYQPN
ncbi:membrane-spanning 4-domains subfamily A member 15-like isoform X2 [Salarias fasciatus]|uniref:membrane-spanning 4-domains subfamily A member 15-like isoform X2 n=1 Tax=Salarias fasciatus TaxID=181472 RepID=UPI0011768CB8|nr:membrane-spanning 4-domains subfamily A member 15-like isoform X2 [Salarias fasciatus]